MKKIVMLTAAALALASCSDDTPGKNTPEPPKRIQMSAGEAASASNANDLAFRSFGELYTSAENLAFSPLSAQMALAMTANGAQGETLAEMLAALCPDASLADVNSLYGKLYETLPVTDSRTNMAIANSFWYDGDRTPGSDFSTALAGNYGATVRSYDSADRIGAATAVNGWVKDATGGVIDKLVTEDDMRAFVIANALYFKSEWTHKFDKKNTATAAFTNANGRVSRIPFMNGTVEGKYGRIGEIDIAELSFGNGAYCIDLVLPATGTTPAKAMAEIAAAGLSKAGMYGTDIVMSMPRFKTESNLSLAETYQAMGMERVFDRTLAELPGIVDADCHVAKILHACSVELDEEGATAAASTAVSGGDMMAFPAPSVTLDRPFAYMIRETSTGVIIFMGAVNML